MSKLLIVALIVCSNVCNVLFASFPDINVNVNANGSVSLDLVPPYIALGVTIAGAGYYTLLASKKTIISALSPKQCSCKNHNDYPADIEKGQISRPLLQHESTCELTQSRCRSKSCTLALANATAAVVATASSLLIYYKFVAP